MPQVPSRVSASGRSIAVEIAAPDELPRAVALAVGLLQRPARDPLPAPAERIESGRKGRGLLAHAAREDPAVRGDVAQREARALCLAEQLAQRRRACPRPARTGAPRGRTPPAARSGSGPPRPRPSPPRSRFRSRAMGRAGISWQTLKASQAARRPRPSAEASPHRAALLSVRTCRSMPGQRAGAARLVGGGAGHGIPGEGEGEGRLLGAPGRTGGEGLRPGSGPGGLVLPGVRGPEARLLQGGPALGALTERGRELRLLHVQLRQRGRIAGRHARRRSTRTRWSGPGRRDSASSRSPCSTSASAAWPCWTSAKPEQGRAQRWPSRPGVAMRPGGAIRPAGAWAEEEGQEGLHPGRSAMRSAASMVNPTAGAATVPSHTEPDPSPENRQAEREREAAPRLPRPEDRPMAQSPPCA